MLEISRNRRSVTEDDTLPTKTGFTAADLQRMEFPPIKYVVSNYVGEGLTILAGAPKIGKSWLALDFAIAVASGGSCMGHLPAQQGDVLYLALEDNRRRLKSRLKRLMPSQGSWPTNLTFHTQWLLPDQGGIENIRAWAPAAKTPRLVIIDVLASFRPLAGSARASTIMTTLR
jgi:predicted ATP-dependent serine protease